MMLISYRRSYIAYNCGEMVAAEVQHPQSGSPGTQTVERTNNHNSRSLTLRT